MAEQAQRLRMINLVEVLDEEAQSNGLILDHPDDLLDRSEQQIRDFFKQKPSTEPQELHSTRVNQEQIKKWFPGYSVTQVSAQPRWRVLCFPNAGNAEDMYTSEGTGKRRSPSPLLLPGRSMRRSEELLSSCQDVARALYPVVSPLLSDVPYIVIAHSVGCWNAFEFLQLARTKGLQMPDRAFLSAMPPPSIAREGRPWREQHILSEEEFKEECRGWDVNELVFSEAMWGSYQPLMRADFKLFDQYTYNYEGGDPFDFPITTFWGTKDRRISESMVHGWQNFTTKQFNIYRIEGNHLWPLSAGPKTAWQQAIVAEIQS